MRVAELWRYPVKSLRGEQLDRVRVDVTGIPGDRGLRVVDARGTVTARRKRAMVALPAAIDDQGEPLIAGHRWGSTEASQAIRSVAGDAARVVAADDGHDHDGAPLLVVTDGGLAQLGADRRRFRPNLVIEDTDGAAELDWVGRRLSIGRVRLHVAEPCERCVVTTIDPDTTEVDPEVLRRTRLELGGIMGVYCSVVIPGEIAVGDRVEVV
ncbi:MAG: MOSC domain-containing protein [Solirubrobacterales bacterium]